MSFGLWARAFLLKGLVSMRLRLAEHSKDFPWWVVLRPAAWNLAARCPKCIAQIVEVCQVVHTRLASWARSHGLLWYAPRQLGSFGLVPLGGLASLKARCVFGCQTRRDWASLGYDSCWDADLACLSRP